MWKAGQHRVRDRQPGGCRPAVATGPPCYLLAFFFLASFLFLLPVSPSLPPSFLPSFPVSLLSHYQTWLTKGQEEPSGNCPMLCLEVWNFTQEASRLLVEPAGRFPCPGWFTSFVCRLTERNCATGGWGKSLEPNRNYCLVTLEGFLNSLTLLYLINTMEKECKTKNTCLIWLLYKRDNMKKTVLDWHILGVL